MLTILLIQKTTKTVQCLVNIGQMLVKFWSKFGWSIVGQILVKFWSIFGQSLVIVLSMFCQILVKCWLNVGQHL